MDEQACDILNMVYNDKDHSAVSDLIHPAIISQHDDDIPQSSREALMKRWNGLSQYPNLHLTIHEAVPDYTQQKVWVRGEVRGMNEGYKEKIFMMTFDNDGLLVKTDDYYRKRRSV